MIAHADAKAACRPTTTQPLLRGPSSYEENQRRDGADVGLSGPLKAAVKIHPPGKCFDLVESCPFLVILTTAIRRNNR